MLGHAASQFKLDFLSNPIVSIAMDYLESDRKTLSAVTWDRSWFPSRLGALGKYFREGKDQGQK